MKTPTRSVLGSIPTDGRLEQIPLFKIILLLFRQRFEGVLQLSREPRSVDFHFAAGAPFLAESQTESDQLVHELVRRGSLSPDAVTQVQERVHQKHCAESVALLSLKLVSATELLHALKSLTRRQMLACFSWPDGRYRMQSKLPREGLPASSRIEPLQLVQQGLTRHWSVEQLLQPLMPYLDQFPSIQSGLENVSERLNLSTDDTLSLQQLDGSCSLGQILGGARSHPGWIAALSILHEIGALELHGHSARSKLKTRTPSPSIEIRLESTSPGSQRVKTGGHPRAGYETQDEENRQRVRIQIEKSAASLHEQDHYAALGLTAEASPAEIKKAYYKAAKTYHPDRLARLDLADLRQTASEIFARIGEAFEILSNPESRRDYDGVLRGDFSQGDAQRLAQAETSFRKGEVLLRMGDFVGALTYLKPAVQLWDQEPAYHSALGWALFKKQDPQLEQAQAHLARAIELGASDPATRTRFETIHRALHPGDSAPPEPGANG